MGGLCTAGVFFGARRGCATGKAARDDPLGKPRQLAEEFEEVELTNRFLWFDGKRNHDAGAPPSISDLMLERDCRDHGEDIWQILSRSADLFIYSHRQRHPAPCRIPNAHWGYGHPKLSQAIQMMEEPYRGNRSALDLARDVRHVDAQAGAVVSGAI